MASKSTSGLPTPPTEECKPVLSSRRAAKSGKTSSRGTKRNSTSLSHEPKEVVMDGRHKRVWKACERCRMKKTKCDGESPCKRCKEDGLVCTAGSRKKTEFKQLPRGYAEVLENTQYALIATVQKLYTMVRNGESWDLGEPELNDRGLPVIHNIAEKLGCIRPSPDMPQSFPEDAEEFAELQAQLFAGKFDNSDSKGSDDCNSHQDRTERASSSESDHSEISKDYTQMLWPQHQQQNISLEQYQSFGDDSLFQTDYIKQEPSQNLHGIASTATNTLAYSSFPTQSPGFRTRSPFSPWPASGNDYLGPSNLLDITAMYLRQQEQQQQQQLKQSTMPRPQRPIPNSSVSPVSPTMDSALPGNFILKGNPLIAGNDGTIHPDMLDYNSSLELADQMDSIIFGEYQPITMT